MNICKFEGCDRPVRVKIRGLCNGHDLQRSRGQELRPLRKRGVAKGELCAFDGCGRDVVAKGLCGGHNQQSNKGKELSPLRARRMDPVGCTANGCSDQARTFSSGQPLCNKHHSRWDYHGDPNKLTKDAVTPLGMAAIADAVANRDRSECWTDWSELPCWEGLGGRYGGSSHRGYPTMGPVKVMWLVMEADGRPRPMAPANHGLHSCDTPACWNPDHLRWGTHLDNIQDLQDSRNYCPHCPHCNPQQG